MTHGLDTNFLVAMEVACHPDHVSSRALGASLATRGDQFAICPQVVAEFIHIVTDSRRFSAPLTIEQALERADAWWNSPDVQCVMPDESSVQWFLSEMSKHQLGRKRVLDTLLAGTYLSAGIHSLLTLDAGDFAVFGTFSCLP